MFFCNLIDIFLIDATLSKVFLRICVIRNFLPVINLYEMEGDFNSMPRAVFVFERDKRKYLGQN